MGIGSIDQIRVGKDMPAVWAESAKRLVSGAGFVLKGSGWAADGYGN